MFGPAEPYGLSRVPQGQARCGSNEKGRPEAPSAMKRAPGRRPCQGPRRRQAIALMAWARRDFVRDARFLWTIFLSAMRSMTACEALSFSIATALSPPAIAFLTSFTAVRNDERRLALCLLVCPACRARFLAWALFAMSRNSFVSGVAGKDQA